jgi:glutamate synthase (NADPH/NADH) small chain
VPRDLPVPGRELRGVCFAMDYLYQRNRWVAREAGRPAPPPPEPDDLISAEGLDVVVVGGGDTAMDCIANVHRERARSVALLDIYPAPDSPHARDTVPWPAAPKRLLSTYALDEGGERLATRTAVELLGRDGHVAAVRGVEVGPPPAFAPLAGTEFELPADLVLVAIGFAHPEHDGVVASLDLALDVRGNLRAPAYATSRPGVFAAGDARRGQSLVVTAIAEGRRCARVVDRFLAGAG